MECVATPVLTHLFGTPAVVDECFAGWLTAMRQSTNGHRRHGRGAPRAVQALVAGFYAPGDAPSPVWRIAGKSTTSRMLRRPVKTMTSRSMPIPMPPVGGIPCSSAWMKASS
jgi:hypothetical protein